jgi:uncharacterized protein YcnI
MILARRVVVSGVVLAFAMLWVASSAGAHITVNPKEATQGSFAKLTFRVPNERDNSSTVKVEVEFPESHPLPLVSIKPTPGWQFEVEKRALSSPVKSHGRDIKEAVSKITWSGGAINPGEFQEFEVSAGPMPKDTDQLVFKALQTYSSGEVVRWIEVATPGGSEPEHPAPILKLLPVSKGSGGHDNKAAEGSTDMGSAAAASGSGGGLALGVVAIILSLAALSLAIGALTRKGKGPAPAPGTGD